MRLVVFIAPTPVYMLAGIVILLLPYVLLAFLLIAALRASPRSWRFPFHHFIVALSLVSLLLSGWMWKRFIDSTNQHFHPSPETAYTESNYMGNVSPATTQLVSAWLGASTGGFAVLSLGYVLVFKRKSPLH
jgi:hypothetical protein